MQALRIRRQLESETIPELKPWVGRNVEIIVLEESASLHATQYTPGTADWAAFERAAAELRQTFDFQAVEDQKAYDLRHAHDHLP